MRADPNPAVESAIGDACDGRGDERSGGVDSAAPEAAEQTARGGAAAGGHGARGGKGGEATGAERHAERHVQLEGVEPKRQRAVGVGARGARRGPLRALRHARLPRARSALRQHVRVAHRVWPPRRRLGCRRPHVHSVCLSPDTHAPLNNVTAPLALELSFDNKSLPLLLLSGGSYPASASPFAA